jgi:hypothetical protein
LATITVTNLYDSGAGSLRDALSTAQSNDTIQFAPNLAGGTLVLTGGELTIDKNITIDGDIAGNGTPGITISGNSASRVFNETGGPAIVARLDGLVIRDGSAGSGNSGGGIEVGQTDELFLTNSQVINNQAFAGGGIYGVNASEIVLVNTSVFGNRSDNVGGGIYAAASATLTMANATISDNYSQSAGGGIALGYDASGMLTNTTLAGNGSGNNGGAIYGHTSQIRLYDSTLTGNYATSAGGGIYNLTGSVGIPLVLLSNSIVAGNAAGGSGSDLDLDGSPLYLHGSNILGSTPANANPINQSSGTYTQIDGSSQAALETVFTRVDHNPHTFVLSGVLADNGGPVKTVAINPAGITYNAGSNAALPPDSFDLNNNGNTAEPLPVDARGFARVAGGTVDIGAFEQQQGTNFLVTTLADNPYDGGTLAQELAEGNGLSLRQAIGLANQDPTSFDSIQFAPSLIGGSTHGVNDGVLLLSNGELTINGNVTIQGDINFDGTPDITIDGQGASRDFLITGGSVLLDELTITGGYGYIDGGGVALGKGAYAPANVTISHSIITNNQAAYGGGISLDTGDSLLLTNSAISGNSAFVVGGGIASKGALKLLDTNVSGNSAGYIGGGIANGGTLTVVNSTLANNQITNGTGGPLYDSAGAGLYNAGSAALVNTTIAGNKGAYAGGGVYNSGGLTLTNATIANNSGYNGGGLYNAACGCGDATLNNTTITGNYAKQFGGGIYNPAGTVTLTNTIVAGNGTGYHGPDILTGPSGITNYTGVNLFSQTGVGRPGTDIVQTDLTEVFANLTTIDPDGVPASGDEFQAGTLANNGGPIETVAIKVGGSAQDTGSTADLPPDSFDLNHNGNTAEPLPVDARGALRVFGAAVDIGAFEAQMPVPKNDFNGDGKSDLLWQNADGAPAIWNMNGTAVIGGGLTSNPGASWQVEASADFNHDNKADIILQNNDGLPQIWLMNGTSVASTVTLVNPGPSWHVVALADFNNDGNPDILWQNNDGAAAIWLMNGTTPIAGGVLPVNPGPAWRVIGAGDVNGDGKADILWQNNDGTPAVWEMNGTNVIGGGLLLNPGASWHAIGLGDFNGDGNADILWQANDGTPAIWELNGTAIIGGGLLLNPGAAWHVMGPSDFNGDGKADILWQNNDGTPAIWEMNGTAIIGGGLLPNPGATWHVKDDGPISPDQMTSGAQPAARLSSPDAAAALPQTPAAGIPPQFAAAWSSLIGGTGDPNWTHQMHAGT